MPIEIVSGGGSFGINSDAPPVVARVVDDHGNPVIGTGLYFNTQSQSGGANGSVQYGSGTTDGNGAASSGGIVCNSNVGNWRVQVSTSYGIQPTQLVGFENTVPPPTPTTFVVTQGANQGTTLGSSFPQGLQTRVLDQHGQPLLNCTVTYYSPTSGPGCTWGGAYNRAQYTDASGYATAPPALAVGAAGNFSVSVQWYYNGTYGPIILIPQSIAAVITPVITSISTQGGGQIAPINTYYGAYLTATVYDQNGNVMPGLNVTFTCPASGASGIFNPSGTRTCTVTTNSSGVAQAQSLQSNATGGSFNCVVTVGGSALTANIALIIATGAPVATYVRPLQGDNQSVQVGTAFPVSVYARVYDQYGNGLNGVAYNESAPGSGASCTGLFGAGTSNSGGNCYLGAPTANATPGAYQITCAITALGVLAMEAVTRSSSEDPPIASTNPLPVPYRPPRSGDPMETMPPEPNQDDIVTPFAFPSCTINCTNTPGPPAPPQAAVLLCNE